MRSYIKSGEWDYVTHWKLVSDREAASVTDEVITVPDDNTEALVALTSSTIALPPPLMRVKFLSDSLFIFDYPAIDSGHLVLQDGIGEYLEDEIDAGVLELINLAVEQHGKVLVVDPPKLRDWANYVVHRSDGHLFEKEMIVLSDTLVGVWSSKHLHVVTKDPARVKRIRASRKASETQLRKYAHISMRRVTNLISVLAESFGRAVPDICFKYGWYATPNTVNEAVDILKSLLFLNRRVRPNDPYEYRDNSAFRYQILTVMNGLDGRPVRNIPSQKELYDICTRESRAIERRDARKRRIELASLKERRNEEAKDTSSTTETAGRTEDKCEESVQVEEDTKMGSQHSENHEAI